MVQPAGPALTAATVRPAHLPLTSGEGAYASPAGLTADGTATVGLTGTAVLAGIAGSITAPGNVHALAVLALVVGIAGPASPATTVVAALLALTGGEHTGSTHAGMPAHRTATVVGACAAVLTRPAGSVSAPGNIHAQAGLALVVRLAGPALTAATVRPAHFALARREDTDTGLACVPASRAGTVCHAGTAVLARVARSVTAPGHVHTLSCLIAGVVGGTGAATSRATIGTTFPVITGGKLTRSSHALLATLGTAAIRRTAVAILIQPGLAHLVSAALAAVLRTITASLTQPGFTHSISAAGSAVRRTCHATLSQPGLAVPIAAARTAIGRTVAAGFTRAAGAIATVSLGLALTSHALLSDSACAAGSLTTIRTAHLACTGSELAGRAHTGMPAHGAGAVAGTRRTILACVAGSVSAPRHIHTGTRLTLEVGAAGSAASTATVGTALLAHTRGEGTYALHTLLSADRTGTVAWTRRAVLSEGRLAYAVAAAGPAVCRAGLAGLAAIALTIPAPGHVNAQMALTREMIGAGPAGAVAAIWAALFADTGSERAGALHTLLSTARAGAVGTTGSAVLAVGRFA